MKADRVNINSMQHRRITLIANLRLLNCLGTIQVEWLKNDEPLRGMEAGKYEMVGNGTELRVRRISYADTGAYMCQASSVGGLTRDISSLVVQDEPSPSKY